MFEIEWEPPEILEKEYAQLRQHIASRLSQWRQPLEQQKIRVFLGNFQLTADRQVCESYLLTPDNQAIIFRPQPGSRKYGQCQAEIIDPSVYLKAQTEAYLSDKHEIPIRVTTIFVSPKGAPQYVREKVWQKSGALVAAIEPDELHLALGQLGIEVPPTLESEISIWTQIMQTIERLAG